ncbi:TPA: helix-turn-helix transcriptional regulator [Streptococcus suis]|nr:helix-turn-helix transcriptional regulator [Streptococcus suis]HEL2534881.1 helix-turn-helix transcriptional regulator [Streptococcus suis]HEM2787700.1 helix-turn-helix transcriptional regulator [Streptococcus suis]HEM3122678.1 helix-turn-helix transcriptional regulator [Streptococcus suis]HEM6036946.1 helix-turn-helix transcriptional regulator [Streptococcus suis]
MNRLKELRNNQKEKLTQEQLAEIIGVTKRTIIAWENGERQIKPDKAQALADHFGVPVGYLLGYEEARRDYLTAILEKYGETVETTMAFAGYGLLALTKGEEVTDKVIENLRQFNDYYGTKVLNSEEAKEWDEEGKEIMLQAVKSYADNNIERFLAGLMAMNNDIKFTIIDFLTLDPENREAISKIITSLADNPIVYRDFDE